MSHLRDLRCSFKVRKSYFQPCKTLVWFHIFVQYDYTINIHISQLTQQQQPSHQHFWCFNSSYFSLIYLSIVQYNISPSVLFILLLVHHTFIGLSYWWRPWYSTSTELNYNTTTTKHSSTFFDALSYLLLLTSPILSSLVFNMLMGGGSIIET